GVLDRLEEEAIGLFASLDGCEQVRLGEEGERHAVARHEPRQVDRLGGLGIGLLDVLIAHDDVAIALDAESADDVVLADFLAAFLVDLAVADGREVALVEEIEVQALGCLHRHQLHADVHQAEADAPLPDRTCHGALLAQGTRARHDTRTSSRQAAFSPTSQVRSAAMPSVTAPPTASIGRSRITTITVQSENAVKKSGVHGAPHVRHGLGRSPSRCRSTSTPT